MSTLGQAIRTYLSGYSGYSTRLPGGISPDQSAQGNTGMPYAVYQASGRSDQRLLNGAIAKTTERVILTIVGDTRGQSALAKSWVKAALQAAPTRVTVGSLLIDWWRVEDDGQDGNEPYADGSDEAARTASIEIVGSYAE